jgi:hypothetical protein
MRIRHVRTLVHYDAPQVFEARDPIGGHYIAVMGPAREIQYLVVGVAPKLLRLFREGEIDLLSLIHESDTDARYTTTTIPFAGDELEVEPFGRDLDTSGFMPDPGFVLEDLPSADLMASAGGIRLVLTLDDRPGRVGTGAYTELIRRVQVLTRNVLVSVEAGRETWRRREVLDVVVPAAAGSFRVVLDSSIARIRGRRWRSLQRAGSGWRRRTGNSCSSWPRTGPACATRGPRAKFEGSVAARCRGRKPHG